MDCRKTIVRVGLEKPVRILHITDTHLTLTDQRDNERKRLLGKNRTTDFRNNDGRVEKYLQEQIEYGHEHCDMILHTGDLIDFVSAANLERAAEVLKDRRILFIAGNHEYSQYVGEAWEDDAYRMNSYMQIRDIMKVDLRFASRIIGGMNIVAIDNGYYRFDEWQLERLKMETAKGYPIILAFHNPLFEQSLYDHFMKRTGSKFSCLVGCDEEHLLPYDEYRALQQRPTASTMDFIHYIEKQPLIKAILAGHLHEHYESRLACGMEQYVTGGGYENMCREVTII